LELDGSTYLGLDTYAAALASIGQFAQAATTQQQAIAAAPAGDKADLSQRLSLYQQERPFIERAVASGVQLATAQDDVETAK
jgi:hypothetical protein